MWRDGCLSRISMVLTENKGLGKVSPKYFPASSAIIANSNQDKAAYKRNLFFSHPVPNNETATPFSQSTGVHFLDREEYPLLWAVFSLPSYPAASSRSSRQTPNRYQPLVIVWQLLSLSNLLSSLPRNQYRQGQMLPSLSFSWLGVSYLIINNTFMICSRGSQVKGTA